jgi:hypothetical protein
VGKGSKKPGALVFPAAQKQPRIAAPHVRGASVAWRFTLADRNGPFAWPNLSEPSEYKVAVEHLHQFEQMDAGAIERSGSHFIEIDALSKEAKNRLIEIKLDDLDGLFSFRIQGKPRIFCRTDNGYMDVLWWDPEHQVCPSAKRNT